MVNGNWIVKLTGQGKVHPSDANEIQQLIAGFIVTLEGAGHTDVTWDIRKRKIPPEPEE